MNRIHEIEKEILRLKGDYEAVEGKETEIYTRIVGYYRSVKNWNKGKREEYRHRVTFMEPQSLPSSAITAEQTGTPSLSDEAVSYLYFYRRTCPNCPPVAAFIETLEMNGERIDVDTLFGMKRAEEYVVLSTPTVIFLDASGREVSRGTSSAALENYLKPVYVA